MLSIAGCEVTHRLLSGSGVGATSFLPILETVYSRSALKTSELLHLTILSSGLNLEIKNKYTSP